MENVNLESELQSGLQWLIEKITLEDQGDVVFLNPTISKEDIQKAQEMDNMDPIIKDRPETNFEIGFRMHKEGYGIWHVPSDANIEEWVKGYSAAKELANSEILITAALILSRKDLIITSINKEFSSIDAKDFKTPVHLFLKHDIVLFIDDVNGQTMFLKNRFGNI
jgi:hypothetical protein